MRARNGGSFEVLAARHKAKELYRTKDGDIMSTMFDLKAASTLFRCRYILAHVIYIFLSHLIKLVKHSLVLVR